MMAFIRKCQAVSKQGSHSTVKHRCKQPGKDLIASRNERAGLPGGRGSELDSDRQIRTEETGNKGPRAVQEKATAWSDAGRNPFNDFRNSTCGLASLQRASFGGTSGSAFCLRNARFGAGPTWLLLLCRRIPTRPARLSGLLQNRALSSAQHWRWIRKSTLFASQLCKSTEVLPVGKVKTDATLYQGGYERAKIIIAEKRKTSMNITIFKIRLPNK